MARGTLRGDENPLLALAMALVHGGANRKVTGKASALGEAQRTEVGTAQTLGGAHRKVTGTASALGEAQRTEVEMACKMDLARADMSHPCGVVARTCLREATARPPGSLLQPLSLLPTDSGHAGRMPEPRCTPKP